MGALDLNALANGPMARGSTSPSASKYVRDPAKRKPTLPRGHIMPPGTGPAGETCKTCAHIYRNRDCAKVYIKCGAARHKWTGGTGSDIRAGDAACSEWTAA